MKFFKLFLPVLFLITVSICLIFISSERQIIKSDKDESKVLLPANARDVVVLVLDFTGSPSNALDEKNLKIINSIDTELKNMEGLKAHSSLLSASVVKTSEDELNVLPYIPEEIINSYDLKKINIIKKQYSYFPEIKPYLSEDFMMTSFYLEPGITYPASHLIQKIEELQKSTEATYGITFEFTGLKPIKVFIERFLTQDILKMLPLLFILVSIVYFVTFRNPKILIISWFVKILSTFFAFGCYLLFCRNISILIILIPTFNIGLLSDYLIHMFYHIRNKRGIHPIKDIRKYLIIPLTLTATTSIIGFLSLILMEENSHILVGFIISISILTTYLLTLWWIPSVSKAIIFTAFDINKPAHSITKRINRLFTILFIKINNIRIIIFITFLVIVVISLISLPHISIQPYPLKQLPESSTILKAERLLNEDFAGTVPFTLEIDSGNPGTFLDKTNLKLINAIHTNLDQNKDIGFQNSIIKVIEKIHYYFNNSNPAYLTLPNVEDKILYRSLIEQYLLFYSSSVSPVEYESLIDSSFRIISIQGILKYTDSESITMFLKSLNKVKANLPDSWCINLHGTLEELLQRSDKLRNNWFLSFAAGSLIIFLTVLIFFRDLKMSVISILPSFIILLMVTGIVALFNIRIDEYTIIFIAVTTGLTIDYTIHILNAIKKKWYKSASTNVIKYAHSIIKSGGIPVFLSFLTSIFSFAIMFTSSFSGAVNLAIMLTTAIGSAFFISVFILPIFFIPGKKNKINKNSVLQNLSGG